MDPLVILVILSVLVLAVATALVLTRAGRPGAGRSSRSRTYTIDDTGERIALADAAPAVGAPVEVLEDRRPMPHTPQARPSEPASGTLGRVVRTIDGETLLTKPPFALRGPIYTSRQARFVARLIRRLPPWALVCPKVRLDTFLTPTRPDGRDPADWREWRKRTRQRAVDLLIVDRRTWKPVLAIMFSSTAAKTATTIGGGEDRIIDEILTHAGLPLARISGDLKTDWSIIAPHVDAMILPPISDEQVFDAADRLVRVQPEAAATLLKNDSEGGWMLE